MRKNEKYDQPNRVKSQKIEKPHDGTYLRFVADNVLWKEMKKAAKREDYDLAIVYRNELIKRGKLPGNTYFK